MWDTLVLIATGLLVIVVIAVIHIAKEAEKDESNDKYNYFKRPRAIRPEKVAGNMGEQAATNAIRRVLREDDILLTDVTLSFEEKETELDNVIINQYGVFIIEVKNYKGRLYGEEDDYEWMKFKDDGYGNTFERKVKNPIKQVKRQTYILANYLKSNGIEVWIEGYALFVQGNCPIQNEKVVYSLEDVDRVIHTKGKNRLSREKVEKIRRLLNA